MTLNLWSPENKARERQEKKTVPLLSHRQEEFLSVKCKILRETGAEMGVRLVLPWEMELTSVFSCVHNPQRKTGQKPRVAGFYLLYKSSKMVCLSTPLTAP